MVTILYLYIYGCRPLFFWNQKNINEYSINKKIMFSLFSRYCFFSSPSFKKSKDKNVTINDIPEESNNDYGHGHFHNIYDRDNESQFIYQVEHVVRKKRGEDAIKSLKSCITSPIHDDECHECHEFHGLQLNTYYLFSPFPSSSLNTLSSFSSWTCSCWKEKLTLLQYLLLYHPCPLFLETLLLLEECDLSLPVLSRYSPTPLSFLSVVLQKHFSHSTATNFIENQSRVAKVLSLIISHSSFQNSLCSNQHILEAIHDVLEHPFGTAVILRPLLFHYPVQFWTENISSSSSSSEERCPFETLFFGKEKVNLQEIERLCNMLIEFGVDFSTFRHGDIPKEKNEKNKKNEKNDSLVSFQVEKVIRKTQTFLYHWEKFVETYLPSAKCPMTLKVFVEPILTDDGHTYERKEFEKWVKRCFRNGLHPRSPMTNLPLTTLDIKPNTAVRMLLSHVRRVYFPSFFFIIEESLENAIGEKWFDKKEGHNTCYLNIYNEFLSVEKNSNFF